MQKIKYIVLLALLFADLGYSAYQHYHMPIGGDMAEVVIPSAGRGYDRALHDPFGLGAVLKNETYPNPNRFFAHWSASVYFLNMPILLQNLTDPISSIYLSIAIIKILIQALLIYLLAVFISNSANPLHIKFLLAAALVTPFFQAFGFCRTLGIIDQSAIYTFFYAMPLALLLLFYLPFFRKLFYHNKTRFNLPVTILLSLLIIFLSFNGPLIPGIVLIACPLVLLNLWILNYRNTERNQSGLLRVFASFREIPIPFLFLFLAFCLLSLYSLYIGRSNSLNQTDFIPLLERYSRVPAGIYNLLTKKIAFPLLLSSLIINLIIIRKYFNSDEGRQITKLAIWAGIFSAIYIMLLPLGGYREYREHSVRYDTIMPVTVALIFIFGKTSLYLTEKVSGRFKPAYFAFPATVLIVFSIADQAKTSKYECERKAIETIAASPEKIILLENNCPVMDWKIIDDPMESSANAELLVKWNITREKKLYYHSRVSNPGV